MHDKQGKYERGSVGMNSRYCEATKQLYLVLLWENGKCNLNEMCECSGAVMQKCKECSRLDGKKKMGCTLVYMVMDHLW